MDGVFPEVPGRASNAPLFLPQVCKECSHVDRAVLERLLDPRATPPCANRRPALGRGENTIPMAQNNLFLELPEVRLQFSNNLSWDQRPCVRSSVEVVEVLRPIYADCIETYEMFTVLLLDRGCRVKGIYRHSVGGVAATVFDSRLVWAAAIKSLASAVVLCHNHPSGQLRPSDQDIAITRKAIDAGKLLDIAVHDHIILTRDGYFSFADNGMM